MARGGKLELLRAEPSRNGVRHASASRPLPGPAAATAATEALSSGARVLLRMGDGAFAVLLLGLLGVVLANIVARDVFNNSLPWWLDAARLLFVYLALIGGLIGFETGDTIHFDEILRRLPERARRVARGAGMGAVVVLSAIECYEATLAAISSIGQTTTLASIPLVLYGAPFAAAFLIWGAMALRRCLRAMRDTHAALGMAIGALLIAGPFALQARNVVQLDTTAALGVGLCLMLVLLIADAPLNFVLLAGAYMTNAIGALTTGQDIPLDLVSSTSNVLLLAIPFFLLVGYLLTDSGLSRPLTRFFEAAIGHLPGGDNLVVLAAMFIFSGISGSKVSDVVAVSSSLSGVLGKEAQAGSIAGGLGAQERVGVLCAAAIAGESIPPSLVLLVLGSVTTLSITKLFMAGILPAVVMFVLIAVYSIALALRRPERTAIPWLGLGETVRRGIAAGPVLLIPLILLLGIGAGFTTPLEASAMAAIYGFVISLLFNRGSFGRMALRVAERTARFGGSILVLILFAVPLARTITLSNISSIVASLVTRLGGGEYAFILVSIAALVIFGQLLEGLPALLLFGPLLVPLASRFGVPDLQFAIILTVALGLGAFAPPLGVGLFATLAVEGRTLDEAARPWLRYVGIVLIGLALVVAIPAICTYLPGLLGGR